MMWLTITPARLTTASSAMKPSGECVTNRPTTAPIRPSGTASSTTPAFITELNCTITKTSENTMPVNVIIPVAIAE